MSITSNDLKKSNSALIETRENLSSIRKKEIEITNTDTALMSELEKTYGKYLFVPYDIPKILPNDIEKFVDYFFKNAKGIQKLISDFSGSLDSAKESIYVSINSVTPVSGGVSWSINPNETIYTDFPEIFEQIHDLMPWVGDKDFKWSMWSSIKPVTLHRDIGGMFDAPISARIKLFDTNPFETLTLHLDPIEGESDKKFQLPIPKDTNSFAWNNVRTKHKSIFIPSNPKKEFRKILFIWRGNLITPKQINQYVDLLERSISSYQNECIIDTEFNRSNYLLD